MRESVIRRYLGSRWERRQLDSANRLFLFEVDHRESVQLGERNVGERFVPAKSDRPDPVTRRDFRKLLVRSRIKYRDPRTGHRPEIEMPPVCRDVCVVRPRGRLHPIDDLHRRRVHDIDGVIVTQRHEDLTAITSDRHFVRGASYLHAPLHLIGRDVHRRKLVGALDAYVKSASIGRDDQAVRVSANLDRADDFHRGRIDYGNVIAFGVGDVHSCGRAVWVYRGLSSLRRAHARSSEQNQGD